MQGNESNCHRRRAFRGSRVETRPRPSTARRRSALMPRRLSRGSKVREAIAHARAGESASVGAHRTSGCSPPSRPCTSGPRWGICPPCRRPRRRRPQHTDRRAWLRGWAPNGQHARARMPLSSRVHFTVTCGGPLTLAGTMTSAGLPPSINACAAKRPHFTHTSQAPGRQCLEGSLATPPKVGAPRTRGPRPKFGPVGERAAAGWQPLPPLGARPAGRVRRARACASQTYCECTRAGRQQPRESGRLDTPSELGPFGFTPHLVARMSKVSFRPTALHIGGPGARNAHDCQNTPPRPLRNDALPSFGRKAHRCTRDGAMRVMGDSTIFRHHLRAAPLRRGLNFSELSFKKFHKIAAFSHHGWLTHAESGGPHTCIGEPTCIAGATPKDAIAYLCTLHACVRLCAHLHASARASVCAQVFLRPTLLAHNLRARRKTLILTTTTKETYK